MKHNNTI